MPSNTAVISVCKEDAMKSEILWCFKTVSSHCSNKFCEEKFSEESSELFKPIFPDSILAKNF